MDSLPTDEVKPSSRGTPAIVVAVGGGIGITGVGLALAAFALRSQHLVLSTRTLYALLGLLCLYGITMAALVVRLARGAPNQDEPTTPKSTQPNDVDEATRRVRLLRGTDDL